MLTVVFNPKEFVIANLLPQRPPFTMVYFIDDGIISLANRNTQQRVTLVANGIDIAAAPSTILPGMSKNK
jgi:hypothetical protein